MKAIEKNQVVTREMIESLSIGDILPNVFGQLMPVTSIHHKGLDVNGRMFACFYQKFSESSTMSHSIKEGEVVSTL